MLWMHMSCVNPYLYQPGCHLAVMQGFISSDMICLLWSREWYIFSLSCSESGRSVYTQCWGYFGTWTVVKRQLVSAVSQAKKLHVAWLLLHLNYAKYTSFVILQENTDNVLPCLLKRCGSCVTGCVSLFIM